MGGFEPILNRMTVNNFNWYLHSLLFIHMQRVISKQREKAEKQKQRSEEVDEDEDGDIEGIDIEQEE